MKHFSKLMTVIFSFTVVISTLTIFSISPVATSASSINLRIEGQKATIYSDSVTFTPGEDFYDIMTAALAAKNIPIVATLGEYGHEITSIGEESGVYPLWWHLYVNDKSSDYGADTYIPQNGDSVVFYIGDDSIVQYPTITLSPTVPIAGQQETLNVSATYTDYSDYNNPVTKTQLISNAVVSFNGENYTTGSDGNVTITMPTVGSYTFNVTKDTADTTFAIVRTGDIPLIVSAIGTAQTGAGGSGSTPPPKTPVVILGNTISTALNAGAGYIATAGDGYWNSAFALEAAGKTVPKSYYADIQSDLDSFGSTITPTHLAGDIIGLKAAGADPQNFNGKNLVAELYNRTDIGKTGLNGYAYALLALDCGSYIIPSNTPFTRDKLIAGILSYQNANGSFALDKDSDPDCDMTAIAITALSPYLDVTSVKTAINSAVAYLAKVQTKDGGYVASYSTDETSESTSQVVIALASVGINPLSDSRFLKNGNSLISNILSYKQADGGFAHTQTGTSDLTASEQAVEALSAYDNLTSGANSIYNLSDVSAAVVTTITNPNTGNGGVASTVVFAVAALLTAIALKKKK